MRLDFHKNFIKQYRRLDRKTHVKVDKAIDVFRKNPFDRFLQNHPLCGQMKGRRAFYVTGNIRVIFREFENYTIVLMLNVGTHNQVYK